MDLEQRYAKGCDKEKIPSLVSFLNLEPICLDCVDLGPLFSIGPIRHCVEGGGNRR